jgi:hypothetical protein
MGFILTEAACTQIRNFGAAAALAGLFALPPTAQAQSVPGGAARGAEEEKRSRERK